MGALVGLDQNGTVRLRRPAKKSVQIFCAGCPDGRIQKNPSILADDDNAPISCYRRAGDNFRQGDIQPSARHDAIQYDAEKKQDQNNVKKNQVRKPQPCA
jgi:hypothetical protein